MIKKGQREYYLEDVSGAYRVETEFARKKDKLVYKKILYDFENKIVEKVLLLNTYIPEKGVMFPSVSQATTWIDKKKHFSSIKSDMDKQHYNIYVEPSNKKTTKKFVNAKLVCAFSMIQLCIENFLNLDKLKKGKVRSLKMWIMWDQFPFHKLMYTDVYSGFMDKGILSFDRTENGISYFALEFSGQIISFLFNSNNQFEKMYWVAQGLSLVVK